MPLSADAMPIERVTGASGVEAVARRRPFGADRDVAALPSPGGRGQLDPAGKEGTASMVAALLDEGAGPLDGNAFHRRLDDLAGELAFGAGKDEFAGSLAHAAKGKTCRKRPNCCACR